MINLKDSVVRASISGGNKYIFSNLIPDLIYKVGVRVLVNGFAVLKVLDALSFLPRYLYSPMNRCRPNIIAYRKLPATGIITSRGCAGRYVFYFCLCKLLWSFQ